MITEEDIINVVEGREREPEKEKLQEPAEGTLKQAAEEKKEEAPNPVREVLSEYGVGEETGTIDTESLVNRITELESELDYERQRKFNPVYHLSEDEINDKVEALRDKGKHTEAEKMLKEWNERDSASASSVSDSRRKAAEREVMGYISSGGGNEKLANLLQDKTLAPVIKELTGIINLHLPGSARVLHRVLLGYKVGEIARKAEEKGRASISMGQPGRKSTASVEDTVKNLSFRRRSRLSDIMK